MRGNAEKNLRQPLQFVQVVHDEDAGVLDGCVQVGRALVDAVDENARAGDVGGGSDVQFGAAGAVKPELAAVGPLGEGQAEKGFAGEGNGGFARVVGGQCAPVLLHSLIHGGLVIDIERRSVLVGKVCQQKAADGQVVYASRRLHGGR